MTSPTRPEEIDPSDNGANTRRGGLLRGQAWIRWTARIELIWERLWPLLVPAITVALAFLAISWFGVWQLVPAWARYVLLAALALLFLRELARRGVKVAAFG